MTAAFSCAIALAISAGLSGQPAPQAPSGAPTQIVPQPPGAQNLDAIGASKLPDGPGKQIVLISCKDCHTFDRITNARHSPARWRTIVREMEQRGANVDPGDVAPLVQYLAKNFGLAHTVAKPQSQAPPRPPGGK
jgi:hypothetical protein